MSYIDKRNLYYLKSNYDWMKHFIKEHLDWTEKNIAGRAEKMASIYYYDILGKK